MSEMSELKFSLPYIDSCPACGAEYVTAMTCRVCGALLIKADFKPNGTEFGSAESDYGLTGLERLDTRGRQHGRRDNIVVSLAEPKAEPENPMPLPEATSEFLSFLGALTSNRLEGISAPQKAPDNVIQMPFRSESGLETPPAVKRVIPTDSDPATSRLFDKPEPIVSEHDTTASVTELPAGTTDFLDFVNTLISDLPDTSYDTRATALGQDVTALPPDIDREPETTVKIPDQDTTAKIPDQDTTAKISDQDTTAGTESKAVTDFAKRAVTGTGETGGIVKLIDDLVEPLAKTIPEKQETIIKPPLADKSERALPQSPIETATKTGLAHTVAAAMAGDEGTSKETIHAEAEPLILIIGDRPASKAQTEKIGTVQFDLLSEETADETGSSPKGNDKVQFDKLPKTATSVHVTDAPGDKVAVESVVAKNKLQPVQRSVAVVAPVPAPAPITDAARKAAAEPVALKHKVEPATKLPAVVPAIDKPSVTVTVDSKIAAAPPMPKHETRVTATKPETVAMTPLTETTAVKEAATEMDLTGEPVTEMDLTEEPVTEMDTTGEPITEPGHSLSETVPLAELTPLTESFSEPVQTDFSVTLFDSTDIIITDAENDLLQTATTTEALPEFLGNPAPTFLATPPEALSRFFDDLDPDLQAKLLEPAALSKTVHVQDESAKTKAPKAKLASSLPEADPGDLPADLGRRYRLLTPRIAISAKADLKRIQRVEDGAEFTLKYYRRGFEIDNRVAQMLDRIRRPQVMSALERGLDKGRAWEIMEYCPLGNLRNLLNEGPLAPAVCRQLVKEVAIGLVALHRRKMAHYNLAPENILIRQHDPLRLTLIDVDIASRQPVTQAFKSIGRSMLYTPPECIASDITARADWWALGMIVLEACLGYHPFIEWDEQRINDELTTRPVDTTVIIDRELRRLCRGLLQRDPQNAWGIDEVGRWLKRGMAAQEPRVEIARAIRPYVLGSYSCRTASEVAAALLENWEQGFNDWKSGTLFNWLESHLRDQNLVQVVRRLRTAVIDKNNELQDSRNLLSFIHLCNPKLTLSWQGRSLSEHNILTAAGSGMVEDQLWVYSLYQNKIVEFIDHPTDVIEEKSGSLQNRWVTAVTRVRDIWEGIYAVEQKAQNQVLKALYPSFRPIAIVPMNEVRVCTLCLLAECSPQWFEDKRAAILAAPADTGNCPWLEEIKNLDTLDVPSVVAIYLLEDAVGQFIDQAREIKRIQATKQAYESACGKFKKEREAFLTTNFPRYNHPYDAANMHGMTVRLISICDEVTRLEMHVDGDNVRADWHDHVAILKTHLDVFQKRLNRCGPLEHLNVGINDMWTLVFLLGLSALPLFGSEYQELWCWACIVVAFFPCILAVITYTYLFVTNPVRRRRARLIYRKVRQMAAKTREYDNLLLGH